MLLDYSNIVVNLSHLASHNMSFYSRGGLRVSPGLKSTYDGLASTPVCMTPISASPGRKTGRRLVPSGTSRKVVRA